MMFEQKRHNFSLIETLIFSLDLLINHRENNFLFPLSANSEFGYYLQCENRMFYAVYM